jgi:signal transduction histidine kinase
MPITPRSGEIDGKCATPTVSARSQFARGTVEFLAPCDEQLEMEMAPATRRHVLLFFKEAVTNVARHAEATAVQVEIEVGKGRFRMSIRDNGRGFDPLQPRAGRGLKSLQYRAGELRGGFQVQSELGGGTEIELSLLL